MIGSNNGLDVIPSIWATFLHPWKFIYEGSFKP